MLTGKKYADKTLDVQEEDVVGGISKLTLTSEPFVLIDQDSGSLFRLCDFLLLEENCFPMLS